jgi:hypothetical protein
MYSLGIDTYTLFNVLQAFYKLFPVFFQKMTKNTHVLKITVILLFV